LKILLINRGGNVKQKTGRAEWAEDYINIQLGCENNCRYCYAREMALRHKRINNHDDWENIKPYDNPKVKKFKNLVMFPTTHDITEKNIFQVKRTLRKLLDFDNKILIVSKPRFSCIKKIIDCIETYDMFGHKKKNIEFRFTISSTMKSLSNFWEPGAPDPQERIECLKLCFDKKYKTSVSVEPILGGYQEAISIYNKTIPYITECIWFGKINDIKRRVYIDCQKITDGIKWILEKQSDTEILKLYKHFKNISLVKFKDSIMKIVNGNNK